MKGRRLPRDAAGRGGGGAPLESSPQSYRQAGVIPYALKDGDVMILLVTSRDTGRWVIPKGNIDPGLSAMEAGVKEALEEAGVEGRITASMPLGFFPYFKKLTSGAGRATSVEVYPLLVTKQHRNWREKDQRKTCWVSAWDAARMVDEPGLSRMMIRLVEIVQPDVGDNREMPSDER